MFVFTQILRRQVEYFGKVIVAVVVTFFATKAIVESSLTLPESGFSLQKSSSDLVCYYHYTLCPLDTF